MIKCVSPHHAVRGYMHTSDSTQTPLWHTSTLPNPARRCLLKRAKPNSRRHRVLQWPHCPIRRCSSVGRSYRPKKKVHKHRRKCFADILQVCGPVVGTYDKYMLHMVQHIFLKNCWVQLVLNKIFSSVFQTAVLNCFIPSKSIACTQII